MYKWKIKLVKEKFKVNNNDIIQKQDNCSLAITNTLYSVDKYFGIIHLVHSQNFPKN